VIGIDPGEALLPSDGTESYEMPLTSDMEFSSEADEVLSTEVEDSSTEVEGSSIDADSEELSIT